MKILIFENVLTHYRLKFYNYLFENYNIDIVFMTPSVRNSDGFLTNYNNAKFEIVKIKKINILNFNIYVWPLKYFKPTNIIVCVLSGRSFFNIFHSFLAKISGVPFYWWGHSRNFALETKFQRIKDFFKLLSIVSSSGMLTYTENESKRIRKKLGFLTPNLISLNNTVRTDEIFNLIKNNNSSSMNELYADNFCIGMVGRLHNRRFADLGINSFINASKNNKKIRLIIIGGGEEYPRLKNKYFLNKNVIFTGTIEDENILTQYFKIFKFLINPGLVGLNLIHAMSYGKFTLATSRIDHSPEIHFLVNKFNGIITDPTEYHFTESIIKLIADEKLRDELNLNSIKTVKKELLIDNMANNFLKIIK
jgi:glycosyltransferase involved in cell wall biosynthesis